MNVVAAVTAPAGRKHRNCRRVSHRSSVAGETLQAGVGAIEHEVGLSIVIELPDQPVVGVVASGAVQPQSSLVDIIFAMTVDALICRVVESRARVTRLAGYGRVQPQ